MLIFGVHENPDYDLDSLIELYTQNSFLAYSIFCTIILFFCVYVALSPPSEHDQLRLNQSATSAAVLDVASVTRPGTGHPRSLEVFTLANCSPKEGRRRSPSKTVTSLWEDSSEDNENEEDFSWKAPSKCPRRVKGGGPDALETRSGSHRSGSVSTVASELSGAPLSILQGDKGGSAYRKFCKRVCHILRCSFPFTVRRFCTAAASGICGGNTNVIVQNVMKVRRNS